MCCIIPFPLALLSQEGDDAGKRRNASIVSRQGPIPVQLTESCVRRMHPADVRQAVKWKRCLKCWSVLQPVQWWLCLFAFLLSTTLPTNFPAQICWQIKREKNSWCWDFGSHSWAHEALPIVWLWHWHLERVRGDKKKAVSWYPNCFPLVTVLLDSNHWALRPHEYSLLLFSALWVVFYFPPRDLSCCVWLALTFKKVLE